VFATDDDTVRMVRSNFLITEFWGDETRLLSGWTGHRCIEQDGRWLIQAKQVNLLECDQSIRNPSIVL
jgi:benzoate/toluate 1,2-dioxygenase beta subunit